MNIQGGGQGAGLFVLFSFFFLKMIIKFQEEHWVLIFREMRSPTNTEDFRMFK